MRFEILFDNYTFHPDLQPLWGFSCYLPKIGLLFDTGSNGRVLLKNAQKMGVDLKEARYLFISHPHWDHIGGLDSVLEINPALTLFVPNSFSPRLVHDLQKQCESVVVVDEKPRQLFDGCYSTGVMGHLEHSLIVDSPRGLYLMVGCSHPGIVHIAKRAMEVVPKPIRYIIGGFHLFQKDDREIVEVAEGLRALGVECVTPTHCSGKRAARIFAGIFGDGYIRGGVGERIEC